MANDKRFVKTYSEAAFSGHGFEIWVDTQTGVNYVWRATGYAGGLTPLLDKDGNVVVSDVSEEA